MFANKAAVDGGEGQQIYQLSKILSAELAATVMSFSGRKMGPQKPCSGLT